MKDLGAASISPIGPPSFESAELDMWADWFWTIYGQRVSNRPLFEIVLELVADSTRLSEAIRLDAYDKALPSLASTFSWLCVLFRRCQQHPALGPVLVNEQTLSQVIWEKYPGLCPYCGHAPCVCSVRLVNTETGRKPLSNEEERSVIEARRRPREQISLNGWVDLFDEVYGIVNSTRTTAQTFFHFLEEIGEIEIELRNADLARAEGRAYEGLDWRRELADVFSWLACIYLQIRERVARADRVLGYIQQAMSEQEADHPKSFTLSDVIRGAFWDESKRRLVCCRCREPLCECPVVNRS